MRFEAPRGLAFGLDGVLYIADARRNTVYRALPDASGNITAASAVELAFGRGAGPVVPPPGERLPGPQFPVNQPTRLSVSDDGILLVQTEYGFTAFDTVAREAETLFATGARSEIVGLDLAPIGTPSSFVALTGTALLARVVNASAIRIDVDLLSSERDPTRSIHRNADGTMDLVDTSAAEVSRFDSRGRLTERRNRTGASIFTVSYVEPEGS